MTKVGRGSEIAERYRLREPIGAGGIGEVWRADDLELAREVAVKLLNPTALRIELARRRFEREARVAAAVNHPGIVRVYDFGEEDGLLYLVMELVQGRPLNYFIKDAGVPDIDWLVEVARQVAETLDTAHRASLVHRDLKPDNILVSEGPGGPTATLVDFGMAFLQEQQGDLGRMTAAGKVGGTPAYMAPEQATGQELTPAADIYAFGCTLFEALTGVIVFPEAETPAELAAKQVFSAPPRVRQLRPDLPSVLEELVDRCLAKDPAERPSAEALAKRLIVIAAAGEELRGRSRDISFISDRESRMLPAGAPPASSLADRPISAAIVGELDADAVRSLAERGVAISVVPNTDRAEGVDVIFVPLAARDRRPRQPNGSVPVVVEVGSDEVDLLPQLVRRGFADVVVHPIAASKLARCLLRAARRRQDPL
ncbi:MAG: serine/threonine protein kinase [Deltaproteobacteria bacterium]|nr:serine/threonine protein kinase [Deltaproteobacteria bacterium]